MASDTWCPDAGEGQSKDDCGVQNVYDLSYLCENGWQPLLITGFLRDLLIRQWANPDNIISPEMQQYVWKEDQTSGIVIESAYRDRKDSIEKRPAILIKRNSFRNKPIGFSGQHFGGGIASYQNEKGSITQHSTLFAGSHTLFCIHGSGAATEILATEVTGQIITSLWPVRKHLGLRQFTVAEVGSIQELEESTENFVVPITVSWAYEHNWELKEESLALQQITTASILKSAGGFDVDYIGI